MKWQILNEITNFKVDDILKALLENRGLKAKKEIEEFLNPIDPKDFTAKELGIKANEVKKALLRVNRAIEKNESIIVYGDYDADGICATAILWETLYRLTKNVLPYIPERVTEGYGLNKEAILKLKTQDPNLKLIITVDHGIVAKEKIAYAKELGIDVIVCDHHQLGKENPICEAIIHTDKICAAAIAWFMARELINGQGLTTDYLDLVAIATISDLEPLLGVNRSFAKYGLQSLNKTKRCGLLAIMEEAGITPGQIGTFEVSYIIAPRLNAMGRMEHALESLRLICTSKNTQAKELAAKLGATNRERQALTAETAVHAKDLLRQEMVNNKLPKLIFLYHEIYQEGVIGLVAGKLAEEFGRPAIVVSRGEIHSKASARSINGFNIIEAIRASSDLLIDAGGHPMAAGFTVETAKIELLKQKLLETAEKELSEEALQKTLKIDLELPLEAISRKLWDELEKLAPFGLGNPEPVFKARAIVKDFRIVGNDGKHLKLTLSPFPLANSRLPIVYSAIAFNQGYLEEKLRVGDEIEFAYSLSLNSWNGDQKLELKIKDIKKL